MAVKLRSASFASATPSSPRQDASTPLISCARFQSKAAAAGLSLVLEPCPPQLCAPSDISPSSTHSTPPLPVTPHDDDDAEDSWNLIPYNIPWGPDYFDYKAGTLPGPEGVSLFLRSPTPLKNRRTTTACNRCRERKAKCSGTLPSCDRCVARGHECQYAGEAKKVRGATLARRRRRDQAAPAEHLAGGSDSASTASCGTSSDYAASSRALSPKHEDGDDCALLPELEYPAHEAAVAITQWQMAACEYEAAEVFHDVPYGVVEAEYFPPEMQLHEPHAGALQAHVEYAGAFEPTPTLHAPRPMKHSQMVPFLSFGDGAGAPLSYGMHQDVPYHPVVYSDPSSAICFVDVEPRVPYCHNPTMDDLSQLQSSQTLYMLPPYSQGAMSGFVPQPNDVPHYHGSTIDPAQLHVSHGFQ